MPQLDYVSKEKVEEDVPDPVPDSDPEPLKNLLFLLSQKNQDNRNPPTSKRKYPLKNIKSVSIPKCITAKLSFIDMKGYIEAFHQGRISKISTSAGTYPLISYRRQPFPKNVSFSIDKIVIDNKTIDPENILSTFKKKAMSIDQIEASIEAARVEMENQKNNPPVER